MDRMFAACDDLDVEAYRLFSFPVHFHDCYVIGCIAEGFRMLSVLSGMMMLSPGMGHSCYAVGSDAFSYEAVNMSKRCMERLVGFLPSFRTAVTDDSCLSSRLDGSDSFHGYFISFTGLMPAIDCCQ